MSEPTGNELVLLQHGDSFFPSGSVAFSFGLETLVQDGLVRDADDVRGFLVDQICHRWASAERSVLAAAWGCSVDLEALKKVDGVQEAMTLSRELREGSQRAGAALLSVHRKLETPGAGDFWSLITAGETPGHLTVVQGLVWRGHGLDCRQCQLLSAHTFCVGGVGGGHQTFGHRSSGGAVHPWWVAPGHRNDTRSARARPRAGELVCATRGNCDNAASRPDITTVFQLISSPIPRRQKL